MIHIFKELPNGTKYAFAFHKEHGRGFDPSVEVNKYLKSDFTTCGQLKKHRSTPAGYTSRMVINKVTKEVILVDCWAKCNEYVLKSKQGLALEIRDVYNWDKSFLDVDVSKIMLPK